MVSSEPARFLLVVEPGGFESFVREIGEPARELTLPPASSGPPDLEQLLPIAARYGLEITGPPGIPD